ncbi:exonuclease [Cylindrospermopsis phage Cr-LKS3]|nr:exonuclease [Cylindrospermopsis phage Cr-LKS3]
MTDQRTDAWFADRAGKITASRMHDVVLERDREPFKSGPRKGQPKPPPKALTDYAHQLAAERLTGKPRKQIKAAALQWGQDVEPAALAAYQAETGSIVTLCGFITHPLYPFIGASPDFLEGEDEGGEIKSPESSEVHLETLLHGLPREHIEQIQGGLWVTGRKRWKFISYHPDFPPELRLYAQVVERDEEFIAKLEAACLLLHAEVCAIVEEINQRKAA